MIGQREGDARMTASSDVKRNVGFSPCLGGIVRKRVCLQNLDFGNVLV